MADSTVMDINKMKVVELRKELKSRGLPLTGDKAELVSRLQAAMSQDDHGDINLDSDEIDSDGVLEDEDDNKSQTDILDDTAVDTLNEELALAEQPAAATKAPEPKLRQLKRKITSDVTKKSEDKSENETTKKIVLNRAISITSAPTLVEEKEESVEQSESNDTNTTNNKVKITADIDTKTRLELRAKRFGLPVKMSEDQRKEARKQRFGQSTSSKDDTSSIITSGNLTENMEKLRKRAERFGQSVSKIMTDIENKEKLEKRKAKFGTVA